MKLRERQKKFANRTISALSASGDALGIAPTGAGKTVMMAAIVGGGLGQTDVLGDWGDGKALVLQHRAELVKQNRKTFKAMSPQKSATVCTANIKDFTGDAVFGMVQTTINHIDRLPAFDIVAIDEAHHATAPSYRKIIDACYNANPAMKLLGVTATPARGDKHGLRSVFSNISDQITITELVKAGHLVRPRCFAVDIGVKEDVLGVRKTKAGDYNADDVAEIMDSRVNNERVIDEWAERCSDRQTVVFCATVGHAEHLAEMFRERGYKAAHVEGNMDEFTREKTLKAYDKGELQIITNVMVLTEGWDHQPTSCVVLTRPLSFKGLMLQMIGRGLRKVDPERYPGVKKDDCMVLDFGATLLAHGDLEVNVSLHDDDVMNCPECQAIIPSVARECALCGADLREVMEEVEGEDEQPKENIFKEHKDLTSFTLTEIDLLDASPFKWEDFWDGTATICTAIDARCVVMNYRGRWHAFGGARGGNIKMLCDTDDYVVALATADDFMRDHGDDDKGKKTQRWMRQKTSPKQSAKLAQIGWPLGEIMSMSRYRAACAMEWAFNKDAIRAKLQTHYERAA